MEPTPISPVGVGQSLGIGQSKAGVGAVDGASFKDMLTERLADVSNLQAEADQAMRDLVTGKADSIHEVIVAINEADLSFRLMMQMRNKLVEAYKEIMRMQV